jgi:hypothetical protein
MAFFCVYFKELNCYPHLDIVEGPFFSLKRSLSFCFS